MTRAPWTYKLRLLGKNPESLRMDRLAGYMRLFAELLGTENEPIFKGVQKASTGLKAYIPPPCRIATQKRILSLKSDEDSKPARVMRLIESAMGEDCIRSAEIRDESENVIYIANWRRPQEQDAARIQQPGTVDGVVTGLVGADDTLHLHLRDFHGRDLRLVVRSIELSRQLLQRFRVGSVRLNIHGYWIRSESGWVPEASRCTVDSFVDLDETPLSEIFSSLNRIPGNGWAHLKDPMGEWSRIRGIKQ